MKSGIELDERNSSIHPGDDLYRHMNGKWMERSTIPADKSRYGAFTVLSEEAEKAVREIIENQADHPEGSEAKKVGDLYRSFMDENRIEDGGLHPVLSILRPLLEDASPEHAELFRTMGALERAGVSGVWDLFIDNDPGNPERYILFFEQGGLSLPDESYYRLDEFASIRDAFVSHLSRVFTLFGVDDATNRAARVFEVEESFASSHWDNVRSRDAEATYNLWSGEELASSLSPLDFSAWAGELGLNPASHSEVVVRQPSFFHNLAGQWSALSPSALRDWLVWRVIMTFSPYLTKAAAAAHFDFFGKTLSGTPELRVRWKRAVSFVESVMGEAVGKLYVERHFPPASKSQMDELVSTLLMAYRESITDLDWMGENTKRKALEKLDLFRPKIGYPDRWRDYSSLKVSADDLFSNVVESYRFEFARELSKLGKPIDRDEWFMTPQTVNAYYNPGFNEIVFPAAILQYPFFDPNRDPASNYGAIGAVIGHEIGHGFDDQGSRFDGEGRLSNWWSPEDRKAFEQRTHRLIEQFNALSPKDLPGHFVNGELTIGENIGDLGGLAIAWKAYVLSLKGEDPPVVDGLSAAERFFLSWAQSWKLMSRPEESLRLLHTDPHAPAEFRCNQIARNLDVFYEAFGVSEAHELWLDPRERVSIW